MHHKLWHHKLTVSLNKEPACCCCCRPACCRPQDLLVFVDNVAGRRVEECFRVVLRVVEQ